MELKRKTISILLSLCLVAGLTPVNTVFATGECEHQSGKHSVVITKATCMQAGEMAWCCNLCNEPVRTEEIPMHPNRKIMGGKDSTCKEEGHTGDTVCTDCEKTIEKDQAIPKKAHTWGEWQETEATCEKEGSKFHICAVCEDVEVAETTPKKDHTWGEWVETEAPTYTKEGKEERKCSVCGTTETQTIPVLDTPTTPSEVTDVMIEAMQIPDISDIGFDAGDKATIEEARAAYEKVITEHPAYGMILETTLKKIEAAEAAYMAAKRAAFEATEPDIELTKDEFYYNKKPKTPKVRSGLEGFTEGEDYILGYEDNIKAGIGSVVIEGMDDLEGLSVTKDILIRPYRGAINKVTTRRNSMVVTSRDQSAGGITGYQFAWRVTNSGDGWKTKMTSTKNYRTTIKNLKADTRYTVKVRGIVKVDGVRYYGEWSKLSKTRTTR